MRRFALGFVCGIAVSIMVVSWWGAPKRPLAPAVTEPEAVVPVPSRWRHRATVTPAATLATAVPDAGRAESGIPAGNGVPGDPFALVRRHLERGEVDKAGFQLSHVLRAQPSVAVPRTLVERLAVEPRPGVVSHAWNAAGAAVQTWPRAMLIEVLTEIAGDPHGAHSLSAVTGPMADRLARYGHSELELTRRMATSENPRQRIAGMHMAARATPIQYELLASGATSDARDDVRYAAYQHLINHSFGNRDERARRIAGSIAVDVFEGRGSPTLRRGAARALAFGGERGLDRAQELVIAGGLEGRTERELMTALVAGGRLRSLLERATGDREFLLALSRAVFEAAEPRAGDVLALWSYVPQIIETPYEEWTEYIGETLVSVGRPDLAVELVLNRSLATATRVSAFGAIVEEDAIPLRALELGRTMLEDSSETVTMRQGLIDALYAFVNSDSIARIDAATDLARDVAQGDPNEWVRKDAEDLLRSLSERLAQRKTEE